MAVLWGSPLSLPFRVSSTRLAGLIVGLLFGDTVGLVECLQPPSLLVWVYTRVLQLYSTWHCVAITSYFCTSDCCVTENKSVVNTRVQVGELVALASKASGEIGIDADDVCMPPVPYKDGPLQLRSIVRGIFGGRAAAATTRGASVGSEKDALQPPTPSSRADSYTGELAEPGTPLQAAPTGSGNSQTTPALPMPPRRDGAAVGAAGAGTSSVPSAIGTPFASVAQSITASGQLSEASMVAVPTPRGSADHGALSQVRSAAPKTTCSSLMLERAFGGCPFTFLFGCKKRTCDKQTFLAAFCSSAALVAAPSLSLTAVPCVCLHAFPGATARSLLWILLLPCRLQGKASGCWASL